MKDLIWTDPEDLLPEDRPLLNEDFTPLGASTAEDRVYWVASMDTAIAAVGHVRLKRRREQIKPHARCKLLRMIQKLIPYGR